MKKICAILLCFLLSGCFQITEIIKHKSDNSGNYSLVIDFSKSWVKTRAAIMLGEVDGVSIPSEEEIESKLTRFKAEATKIKGVTNVTTNTDFKNYIFKLNFSYNSIETLNKVLNSFDKNNTKTHCKFENGKFERNTAYPFPKNLTKNNEKKEDLSDASITSIYTFDKAILQTENANSKISKSKKTVVLKHSVWNALQNKNLMNNTITLTP
jgi:hypothetical protein